jgi:hypothetical protein
MALDVGARTHVRMSRVSVMIELGDVGGVVMDSLGLGFNRIAWDAG